MNIHLTTLNRGRKPKLHILLSTDFYQQEVEMKRLNIIS